MGRRSSSPRTRCCFPGVTERRENFGPPNISETSRASKLRLKTQLDVVNYSFLVQKSFRLERPGVHGPLMLIWDSWLS